MVNLIAAVIFGLAHMRFSFTPFAVSYSTYQVIMSIAKPNVLWISTDDQSKDSMGAYGSRWAKTPHLDRFAREGILLKNAVTPAPVCVPASVSILTGEGPVKTSVLDNKYSTFREKEYKHQWKRK